MAVKPQPPDFPDLPEKLQKIIGYEEYRAWKEKMEEWRINGAVATEKYLSSTVGTTPARTVYPQQAAVLSGPGDFSKLTGSRAPQSSIFNNKILCRPYVIGDRSDSPNNPIYIVEPPQSLERSLSEYHTTLGKRFLTDADNAIVRLIDSQQRIRFPDFLSLSGTEEDKIDQLKSRGIYEIWIPSYGNLGNLSGPFNVDPVPFVHVINILPLGSGSFVPMTGVKHTDYPNAPVYQGWIDLNTQAARWTSSSELTGHFRKFNDDIPAKSILFSKANLFDYELVSPILDEVL